MRPLVWVAMARSAVELAVELPRRRAGRGRPAGPPATPTGRSSVMYMSHCLVEVAEPGEVLDRRGGVEQPARRPRSLPGPGDPAVHGDVVGVERHPVGTEGQDRVGAHVVEQRGRPRPRRRRRRSAQAAVGQAEDVVLVDAEHRHRRGRLPAADRAEPRRAARRRGSAVPCSPAVAETHTTRWPWSRAAAIDAAGEVRLVVGMGPDRQDRARATGRSGVVVASRGSDASATPLSRRSHRAAHRRGSRWERRESGRAQRPRHEHHPDHAH